jgi:hypothetical protein
VLRDVPLCLTYKLLLIYFTQVRKGFKQASSTCTFYTLLHIHTHFYMHFYTSCYSTHSTVCSKNRNCMIKWDFFFTTLFWVFSFFIKISLAHQIVITSMLLLLIITLNLTSPSDVNRTQIFWCCHL